MPHLLSENSGDDSDDSYNESGDDELFSDEDMPDLEPVEVAHAP